jgi:hypothetical protein
VRVENAFGPKLEHLMRMQLAYDLAQARKMEHGVRVRRYVAKRSGLVRDGADKKGAQRIDGLDLRSKVACGVTPLDCWLPQPRFWIKPGILNRARDKSRAV